MTAASFIVVLLLPFCIFCETNKNGKPSWYEEEQLAWDAEEHTDYLDLFPDEAKSHEYGSQYDDKQHPYQENQHHTHEQSHPDVPKSRLLQYDYEIQTLTGVSDNTLKHISGATMRAKVSFFQANTQQCLMQFDDVKFGKLTKPMGNAQLSKNFDQFEPVSVDRKLIALLQLPIKFNCNKKQVSFLICDGDDQPWSTNIKRGAIDLLLPDFHQIFHSDGRTVNSLSLEENVEGKCVVEYKVEKNSKIKGYVYNVTKTIDHDTCVTKPEIKHNFRSLTKCSSENDAVNQGELIKKSGSTMFVVAMTENSPKVVSAEAKNQYTLILSSDKANRLLTFVNQKIKFTGETPGKTVNDPKNPAKTKTGRVYSTEWDSSYEKALMFGRQEHLKHSSVYNTFGSVVNVLKQAFNSLSKNTKSKTSQSMDQNEALLETVTFLRLASSDDLKSLEKSLSLNVDKERKKQNDEDQGENTVNDRYAQALGICGSKTCVQRLVHLIQANRVSKMKAVLALNEIRNAPVVSMEIIKEVVTLARSIELQNSENTHTSLTFYFLKQTLWLLSGSLVRDLCSSTNMDKLSIRQEQEASAICTTQFKQGFVRLIVNNLRKSDEWQDQIIFTKTLGNAGLLESINDLKQLIRNKQKNQQFIRSSAIYALKKMAILKPQYVESILKPIIEDDKEEQELRIASIHVLLSANPDKAFVDYLVKIQKKEQKLSSQVSSYIVSILRKMSASSSHCATNAKTHFTEALRSVNCQAQNQSVAGSFSFNCPAVGAGVDAEFQLSYCNGTAESCGWPFHQVFDLSVDWLGLQQKSLFSVGVVSLDGQELMHKTGKAFWHASKQKPQSMDDLWSHDIGSTVPSGERITDFIVSIIDYIRGVKKQDRTTGHELTPKAVIYIKFKDQNVGFLPISDKLITQALPDLMPQIKRLGNVLKNWLTFDLNRVSMLNDIHYKTATSAGIPISVSFKQPVWFNFKGKVLSTKAQSFPLAISSQIDSSMSARMSTVIDMQTWTPVVISGMKYENHLNLDLSLKGQLNGDLKDKKQILKITLSKPEEGSNILELESKTTSYNTLWSGYISNLGSKEEIILISKNQMTAKHCMEEPITGSTICAKTTNQPEFGRYDIFRPKKLTIWSEADPLQIYPVEIEIMTEQQNQRSHLNDYKNSNHMIINNVKIRSKSNARQASLSFVHMKDPAQAHSKIKAIFAKQWKSDTKEPLLVCFAAEKHVLPEKYDKTQNTLLQSSLNWGGSTCQSTRHLAVKVIHTELSAEQSATKSCTTDSCDSDDTNKPSSTLIVDINYQKVPVYIRNVTNKLYRSLKHAFYAKADVAQIDVKNAAGKIWSKISLPSDTCVQEADITLKMPGENVTFHNIAVPSWICRPFKNGHEKKSLQPPAAGKSLEDSNFGRDDLFDVTDDSKEQESAWSRLQYKSHEQPAKEEFGSHHQENKMFSKDDDDVLRYDNPLEGLEEEFEMWPNKDKTKMSQMKENRWKLDANQDDLKHDREEDENNSVNVEHIRQPKPKQFATEKLKKVSRPSYDTFHFKTIKVCHVDPNAVQTFETISYKFDLPECYTILSKDCSRNGLYVVMTKKDKKTQKFSELFVLTNQHKILLKVEQQNGKQQKFKLLTDDVEQTLNNDVETLARGSHDIRLMKHGNHVDVQLIDMQIDIEFEPSSVTVKMPEKSTINQCGLCGQSQNQDSSHKKWPTASDKILQKYIIDKYVVKSRDCKISQPKEQRSSQYKKPLAAGMEFDPNIDVSAVHHGGYHDDDYADDDGQYNDNRYRKWNSDGENDDYEDIKFF